jgi:hypothetical protein
MPLRERRESCICLGVHRLSGRRIKTGLVLTPATGRVSAAKLAALSGHRRVNPARRCERALATAAKAQFERSGTTLCRVRRIVLIGAVSYLFLAVGTRVADALGVGGVRLHCACRESCWCKRPSLTVFRWVTPGSWHDIV